LPSFSSIFQKKQRLTRSSGAELKGGGCAAAAIKDRVTGAESPPARRNLIGSACQDAGFHASFSPASLL
jgi:hypothetical protein